MHHYDASNSVNHDDGNSQTDLSWLDGLDPSLTTEAFDQARYNAGFAQSDFAEIKERFGASVALADYKRRVIRWLDGVDDFHLERVLYTMASVLDGTTHSWQISVSGKIGAGTKGHRGEIAKDSLLDKYRKIYGETISYPTFSKYLKMAVDYGPVERDGPGFGGAKRRSKGRKYAGAFEATMYHVNFWRTLKDGKVVPRDFYAKLPPMPDEDDRNTGQNTGSDTQSFDLVKSVGSSTEESSEGSTFQPGKLPRPLPRTHAPAGDSKERWVQVGDTQ